MKNFEMARADSGGVPVLRLKGRLTLGEGSKALRAGISDIVAEGHKYLLLDMAGVTYVDSSGLGAMVAGYNALKSKSGKVGLFQVPKRIQDLLEMSGLTAVFKVFHTEQEAVADQPAA
jgi:anti-anti-sigma factor